MKNVSALFFDLLVRHIIITFIAIASLSLPIPIYRANQLVPFSIFLFILFLYALSGYLLTKKEDRWYNYFAVAFVGIAFWILCFIISPDSTNYKHSHGAGLWLLYELYIMARWPINYIEPAVYSLKFDLIGKFIFPIVFSVSQFLGGLFKMKKIKYATESSLEQ